MWTALFAEGPAQQPQDIPIWGNPMLLMMLVMLFLFVVILPMSSRRQKREQEAMLASVKRGSKVQTTSGIVGIVVTAKEGEDEIVVRSEDTRLRMLRSAVVRVLGQDENEAGR
jgi:preprotein translocase subunit YajC